MKKPLLILWPLLAIPLALAGCKNGASSGDQVRTDSGWTGTVEITGSSTLGPLASEIGKRFEQANPQVRVNVQTGGSSRGIADVSRGLADIGMSSRKLHDSEEPGRRSWKIAGDGVGFAVHATNPVRELTTAQLKRIFTGELANWREAGGPDAPITVINRAAGRSELEMVAEFLGIESGEFEADLIGGENQQVLKMVSNDPNAITYVSAGAASYAARSAGTIRVVKLDGVEASAENVASGTYPLSRPLIFVTPDQPSPLVSAFIGFARSPDNHDLIKRLAYVPIEP